jgi:hypothetical protein
MNFHCHGNACFQSIEYNVNIVDDQVILMANKQELEKFERTNIPDDIQVDSKPVVAIIGAGAGKFN